jgi:hypothetical protein
MESATKPYAFRVFWNPAIPSHLFPSLSEAAWQAAEALLEDAPLGAHNHVYTHQHDLDGFPILVGYYLVRVRPQIASKGWCRDIIVTLAPPPLSV